MKREAKCLLQKAIQSLKLSIELFNRPYDEGRIDGVLIFLDHSFEMLLKASILYRGGKIIERGERNTIGFDKSIRKSISESPIQFLKEEEGLVLQAINNFRDAVQHYYLELSEQQLYFHTQTGITLFDDILKRVFGKPLVELIPRRVLPVSSTQPLELLPLFEHEFTEIKSLLLPGKRMVTVARAKLRSLAIVENALNGNKLPPSEADLNLILKSVKQGKSIGDIFSSVSSVATSTSNAGPYIAIRLTKKEGIPVNLVPEGTPNASVVAVKRVGDLDFYCFGLQQVANRIGMNMPKSLSIIKYLKLQESDEYFKEIRIGAARFKRYSQSALARIHNELPGLNINAIWDHYKKSSKKRR